MKRFDKKRSVLFLIVFLIMIFPVLYIVDAATWMDVYLQNEEAAEKYFNEQMEFVQQELADGCLQPTRKTSDELSVDFESTATLPDERKLIVSLTCRRDGANERIYSLYWSFWMSGPNSTEEAIYRSRPAQYAVLSRIAAHVNGVISAERIQTALIRAQDRMYEEWDGVGNPSVKEGGYAFNQYIRAYICRRINVACQTQKAGTGYTETMMVEFSSL